MINKKPIKLSENELENIHGTTGYNYKLKYFGYGVIFPIDAAKVTLTGKDTIGNPGCRIYAWGALTSVALIIAASVTVTHFAPTIYQKIKNAINK